MYSGRDKSFTNNPVFLESNVLDGFSVICIWNMDVAIWRLQNWRVAIFWATGASLKITRMWPCLPTILREGDAKRITFPVRRVIYKSNVPTLKDGCLDSSIVVWQFCFLGQFPRHTLITRGRGVDMTCPAVPEVRHQIRNGWFRPDHWWLDKVVGLFDCVALPWLVVTADLHCWILIFITIHWVVIQCRNSSNALTETLYS